MQEQWGMKANDIFGTEDPSYHCFINYSCEELLSIVSAADEFNWSLIHATAICPSEAISRQQALKIYTTNNAFASIHFIQTKKTRNYCTHESLF